VRSALSEDLRVLQVVTMLLMALQGEVVWGERAETVEAATVVAALLSWEVALRAELVGLVWGAQTMWTTRKEVAAREVLEEAVGC